MDETMNDITYSYEGIEVVPADMSAVKELIALYEQKEPPPTPPMVQIRTFESVSSGKGYEEVEDRDDEDYKQAVREHKQKIYRIMELYFIRNCVKDKTAALEIMAKDHLRIGLFNYIVNISEITEEAVAEAMRKFRLFMERQTTGKLQHTQGEVGNAVVGVGLLCGSKTIPFTTLGIRPTAYC